MERDLNTETDMPKINYDSILAKVSIDDVARRLGMELQRETTTKAKALCPFHDDKSPSLLIDSSREHGRQHYHCFACGAHGDAIDLVKEQLKIGFKDAVEWLSPGSFKTPYLKKSGLSPNTVKSLQFNPSGLELGYKMYIDGGKSSSFESWANARNLDMAVLRKAGYVHAENNWLSKSIASTKDSSQAREKVGLLEDAYLVRKLFPDLNASYHLQLKFRWSIFKSRQQVDS